MPPTEQRARADAGGPPVGAVVEILVGSAEGPQTAAYRLGPDVLVLVVDDGTARIMDLGGDHFAITETAASILLGTLRTGADRTCRSIAALTGAPIERVRADADALLDELTAAGILLRAGQRPDARSRRAHLTEAAARAALRRWLVRDRGTTWTAWRLIALAWAATHALGWASTARWWRDEVEAAGGRDGRGRGQHGPGLEAITGATASVVARHPLPVACKERALCAYTLTRRAGYPAQLVLGVSVFPFASHVWCESAGRVVGDRLEDGCDQFAPVLTYDGSEAPAPALAPVADEMS
jgi:hypothetical protein